LFLKQRLRGIYRKGSEKSGKSAQGSTNDRLGKNFPRGKAAGRSGERRPDGGRKGVIERGKEQMYSDTAGQSKTIISKRKEKRKLPWSETVLCKKAPTEFEKVLIVEEGRNKTPANT